jgi:1,4-dihydroxy-2-naphthoate octaprenyltransferase
MHMTGKQERTFAILAALLVLFSAMLNPLVSALLALCFLIAYLYLHTRGAEQGQANQ